jgi:spore coat polysaccharide biosynthesis protein SpsF
MTVPSSRAGHDARIGAIIQARTSSTRLPGKVLKELPLGSGVSDLAQVVRRTRCAATVAEVVVATSDQPEDDAIVAICETEGVPFFRGSLEDVLSRYYLAARAFAFDVVVRVTSDCPCIDPAIIDLVVERHLQGDSDYTANVSRRTFPHGLDLEVVGFETLELMNERAETPYEREHVYLERNDLRRVFVEAPAGYFGPDIRVTLDTPRDYALLCAVFDYLGTDFDGKDIVALFQEKPWLKLINLEDAG